MPQQEQFKRIRERLELKLPVRVRCRETPEIEWTEVTRLVDVSPFGARFTLKHPVEKGRLLHMTIPMPRQLRVFDHVEDQYRVWALVRFVKSSTTAESSVFEIGVAFIGKHPPRSYEEDPAKRYDIGGRTADSLSIPEEVQTSATEDQRTQTRHNIPVDIRVETLDDKGMCGSFLSCIRAIHELHETHEITRSVVLHLVTDIVLIYVVTQTPAFISTDSNSVRWRGQGAGSITSSLTFRTSIKFLLMKCRV